jgi:putative nucleotidyltransferase with HDIG domain
MEQRDLALYKIWFSDYCKSFYSEQAEDQKNISLKEQHTHNVCENIVKIAEAESVTSGDIVLAETVALFHDIGRFQQYAEYKTFKDSISVNHATLGVKILSDQGIFNILPEKEQELIFQAIRFHNACSIPDIQAHDSRLLLRLIRDADKLDIWRVFLEYFETPAGERASAAGLGLPDTSGYSQEILVCLFEKRIALLSNLKTLTDFKLLQMSWIYDINFEASLRLLEERGHMNRLFKTVPQTDEIVKATAVVRKYIHQRLKTARSH